MKETMRKMLVAVFPYFIAFCIGSFVGSAMAYRQVLADCSYMNKFRYGSTVTNCNITVERGAVK